MNNLLTKISEYQNALYEKTHENRLIFNEEEEIKLGDNIFIKGICLEKEKNWFVITYTTGFFGTEIPIKLDVFNDSILLQIIHILRKHI